MDLSSADDWKAAVSVVWNATQVVVPLLIVFAGGGYWLGSKLAGAGKQALNDTITAHKAQLDLAREKREAIESKLNDARERISS